MEKSTMAQKPARISSHLRLSTIAVASVIAVFMVTALTAATGDNIADAVLGQIDFSDNGINNTGAASLDSPSQMAVDLSSTPEHLYVVDGSNNRILGWNDTTSFVNGQNADLEIGQPDFHTTLCNSGSAIADVAGLGADSLCLPGGVAVDGSGSLYVADTSNNRVLEYNRPFTQGISAGFAANAVFGQGGSFTQKACAQTAAGLCFPQGVASDSSNNLYVADSGNHRVLEFNQPLAAFNASTGAGDAIADLVFGQGASGTDFAGDACDINSGSASDVGMCNPLSVAVDGSGNVYVGDDGDHRVLEFNQPLATLNVATGAGDVTADRVFGQGSSGTDFTDALCYDGNSGDPSVSADGICDLSGLALDSAGDLFVTDINNSRVLEYLNPLAAGGGSAGTPGSSGDVTADIVFGQGGSFTTVACGGGVGSGIAPSGSVLCLPDGVALDGLGDVFVADASNNRILKYNNPVSSPPVANAVLGQADLSHNGVNNPTAAALQAPQGLAIDSSGQLSRLYVADSGNNRVLGWANAAGFMNGSPADIVIGQPDALSVACNDGVALGDSNGAGADSLCNPVAVAVDSLGHLYVADYGNSRVLEYNDPFGAGSPVGLSANVVFGQDGSFTGIACDLDANAQTINGSTMCTPAGLALDTAGDLFVSDYGNNRVLEFNQPLATPNLTTGAGDTLADKVFGQNGSFGSAVCNPGTGAPTADSLCGPRGLVVDPMGDLFVADLENARVLEFNQPLATLNPATGAGDTTADRVFGQGNSGTSFTTAACASSAGNPPLNATDMCLPFGISLDDMGNLFVADALNNRVLEYNQPLAAHNAASGAGDVTADLVLGQGPSGADFADSVCADSAPGDPAPSATAMCQPKGVALDSIGNLYVADETNNRVLRFDDPVVPFTGATPTASATATGSTPTVTPTATATASPTVTATQSASPTVTATPSLTATATPTPTATATPTTAASRTATPTQTASATTTATSTATPTNTATATNTSTRTATLTPTATATATRTSTATATNTATASATDTASPTQTATATATASSTRTATATSTATATATVTSTATATSTPSPTPSAVRTPVTTATATATTTPTATPTATTVPVALKVSPHVLKLGKVVFENDAISKPKRVTIENKSKTTPVTFLSIVASGDFAAVSGCGATIRPKSKCSVSVTFKPTALGARGGTLSIKSNANNSPTSVGLTGIGTQAKKK
jgi:NHL repeat